MEYNKSLHKGVSPLSKEVNFENWLSNKISRDKTQFSAFRANAASIVEIPVVVHVIHNGEALGSGVNITDEQISSQIEVFNEDFRRLNPDRVNTPSEFEAVAADVQVEFVMARRDPEGLATSAIIRKQGTRTEWAMSNNVELKALSYWPAEDYLNIWVTAVAPPFLGYAQFPTSNELDGLEEASSNALTDGLIIDYEVFGSIDKDSSANLKPQFNKGRTATHELGHFLGLRHIWGDTGSSQCSTDYCDDTPVQSKSTEGSAVHPANGGCETTAKMFQNYMDYTEDQFMNLFTLDQNSRMRTILENSPRRKSLTTSPALLPAVVYDYDIGLFNVLSPSSITCGQLATPSLLVKNYGNIALNEVVIRLTVNGIVEEILTASLPELGQLTTSAVSFSEINLVPGNNILNFEVISVNDNTDKGVGNNSVNLEVHLPPVVEADITEDFENGLKNMSIKNNDGLVTWDVINAQKETNNNKAIYLDYYDYDQVGARDWLLSEVMDFSSLSTAKLLFQYSHSQYQNSQDQLSVLVSKDCGVTFEEVFAKSSEDLSTVSDPNNNKFTPSGSEDWSSAIVDLSSYIGNSSIQIAFVGQNDYGNNIYLDDINLRLLDIGNNKIQFFPNPIFSNVSADLSLIFNLDKRQKTEIRIFDLAGNQVFSQTEQYTLSQTYTYDMSGLPGGMFILSVIGESFKYNKRIVVVR